MAGRVPRKSGQLEQNPDRPDWADEYYMGAPDGTQPKYKMQSRVVTHGGGVVIETTTLGDGCSELCGQMNEKKVTTTLFFTFTIIFLIATCAAFFRWPSLLLYFYVCTLPIFILCRVVYYFTQGWQYHLLDLTNFIQLILFAYLWAGPTNWQFAQVMFGFAFGPAIWSVDFFPDQICFVPHSADRMMNVMFAFYPALIMYNVRHEPEATSDWWYKDFLQQDDPTLVANIAWIFGVVFGSMLVYYILYSLLVYLIMDPDKNTRPTSFYKLMSYEESYLVRFICFFSDSFAGRYVAYSFLYLVAAILCLMMSVFWWESKVACIIFLICMSIYPIWNGSMFYVTTLGPKNFDPTQY